MRDASIYLFLLLLAVSPSIRGQTTSVETEPVPEWVEASQVDLSPLTERESNAAGGYFMLLYDRQADVETKVWYTHQAIHLLTAEGVEQLSSLHFAFEPSYQRLILHRLWIHRNGEVLDLTDTQEIRLREREPNLEANLYDGVLYAEALLRDIRPGDTVEWGYSIEGQNPIFNGHFSDSFGIGLTVPLREFRIRINLPSEHSDRVELMVSDNFPKETLTRKGGTIEFKAREVEPLHYALDAPSWHYPHPWFAVSTYEGWQDVVDWALPLYAEADRLPVELEPVVEKLRALPTEAARIRGAILHAQQALRYVSLSSGLHSHKPYPLPQVLDRRYGDCKDHAVLLTSLLRALEIPAWPALVSTSLEHVVAERLPSPDVFDHVIVGIESSENGFVWIDPTLNHQAGLLVNWFIPRYGRTLLIKPGETGLRIMPGNGYASSSMNVLDTWIFPEEPDAPHRLRVVTTYRGSEAESMRAFLDGNPAQQLLDNYQDYYDRQYGTVRSTSPLIIEDDTLLNILRIEEEWEIDDPWTPGSAEQLPVMAFEPVFKEHLNEYPASMRQERPFPLTHPKNVTHRIEVKLPIDLPIQPESHSEETDYVRFEFESGKNNQTFFMEYAYASKRPHVPWEDLAEHKLSMERALDWSRYELTHPWSFMETHTDSESDTDPEAFRPYAPLFFLAVCMWITGLVGGVLIGKTKIPPPEDLQYHVRNFPHLLGIGGWLILPTLGLFATIVAQLFQLSADGYWNYDADVWRNLTHPESGLYHALWKPSILLSVCTTWLFLGYVPVLIVNLFRRKATVPTAFVILYATAWLAQLMDLILTIGLGDQLEQAMQVEAIASFSKSCIFMPLWIAYFRKSIRVKVTFTNGLVSRPPPPLPGNGGDATPTGTSPAD